MSVASKVINNILESIAQLPEQDRRMVIEKADKQFHAQTESSNVKIKGKKNGSIISNILHGMSKRKALAEITDPSTWQREIRKDKPLLGRDSR